MQRSHRRLVRVAATWLAIFSLTLNSAWAGHWLSQCGGGMMMTSGATSCGDYYDAGGSCGSYATVTYGSSCCDSVTYADASCGSTCGYESSCEMAAPACGTVCGDGCAVDCGSVSCGGNSVCGQATSSGTYYGVYYGDSSGVISSDPVVSSGCADCQTGIILESPTMSEGVYYEGNVIPDEVRVPDAVIMEDTGSSSRMNEEAAAAEEAVEDDVMSEDLFDESSAPPSVDEDTFMAPIEPPAATTETAPTEPPTVEPSQPPADDGFDMDLFAPEDDASALPADDTMPPLEDEAPLDDLPGILDEAPADEGASDLDDLFDSRNTPRDRPAVRTWVDNTGRFRTTGQLLEVAASHVRLLKENGKTCTVPLRRLSDEDFSYVQLQARNLGHPPLVRVAGR